MKPGEKKNRAEKEKKKKIEGKGRGNKKECVEAQGTKTNV